MLKVLKNNIQITHFVLLMSLLNFVFFHFPFFKFVFTNVDYTSFNGILLIGSLVILMLVANAFAFYLFIFLLRIVGKILLALTFIISSVAVYFVNSYGIIIDESMISNIFNTNSDEAGSFFSFKLILYVVLLGILSSIYIIKARITNVSFKKFLTTSSLTLLLIVVMVFANANNWLWIDKNSKHGWTCDALVLFCKHDTISYT